MNKCKDLPNTCVYVCVCLHVCVCVCVCVSVCLSVCVGGCACKRTSVCMYKFMCGVLFVFGMR